MDFGALGNYDPATDTGHDDTVAIQAAINAANTTGGYAVVEFPGRHDYKITATLMVPNGIHLRGLGHQHHAGSPGPPALIWRGAGGGTMVQVGTGVGGNFSNPFSNLQLVGGRDLLGPYADWAACAIDFQNAVDTGTILQDVWVGYINGNAVRFNGSTNSYIYGGRYDRITGYAIYHNLQFSNVQQQIHDLTYDNWDDTQGPPFAKGFLYLNGEASVGTVAAVILSGLHLEVNGPLAETYAAGVNPSDKHGLIRLGINPAVVNIQHILTIDNCGDAAASGTTSHSFLQCTSVAGTVAQHADRIMIRVTNGRTVAREPVSPSAATGTVKLLGNVSSTFEYVRPSRINVGDFFRAGGPVDSEKGTSDRQLTGQPNVIWGLGAPTQDAPRGTMYQRADGGVFTSLYVKTADGAGALNWTAK